jgi:predicted permease
MKFALRLVEIWLHKAAKINRTSKMEIFLALAAIAPVILTGFFSRKLKVITNEHARGLSFFVYYFSLPALFLVKMAELDLAKIDPVILLGSVLPIAILIGILLLLRIVKIISNDLFVMLALSVIFGSNAFFGIPFFESLRGEAGLEFGIITSSILGPLGILGSILLFECATVKKCGINFLKRVLWNPLILSILVGIILSLANFRVEFLFDALDLLGRTAGPVAIFTLGTFFYDNFSLSSLRASLLPAAFRIIFLPLATILIIYFFLESTVELRQLLVLQAGIPAAISLTVFAKRYDYRVGEISNFVILTSVANFLVLGVLFFVTEVIL